MTLPEYIESLETDDCLCRTLSFGLDQPGRGACQVTFTVLSRDGGSLVREFTTLHPLLDRMGYVFQGEVREEE